MNLKSKAYLVILEFLKKLQNSYKKLEKWAEDKLADQSPTKKSSEYYFNLGWWILKLGLGVFLVWAFFAPLDRGVATSGTVISDGQRKVIQAQTAGVIDQIFVAEDQPVQLGDPLIKLNDVMALAGINLSEETVAGLNSQIEKSESSLAHKKRQLKALQTQYANAKSLANEGYLPKNKVLELDQTKASLESVIAQEEASLENLKRIRAEESHKTSVRNQELAWTEIKAPVSGTVVNLQVFTKGGYVPAGSKLMEISPNDANLIAEAELPVNLIDKVHEGMPVRMLFSAFNQNRTPQIPGTLTLVGKDRITNPDTRKPYYKIQAQVTDEGRVMLGELQIKPGMPVEVFVKTGERTFVSYLLKPIIDRLGTSLREH